MPTYEYKCDSCEHTFDEIQGFSEPPLTKCPKCEKKKLRRLFGAGSGIIFKGSGFYQTDYKSVGGDKDLADAKKLNDTIKSKEKKT